MKAALLYGPADLRIVDIDQPRPEPEDALVRVVRYAPYGTDIGTYLNRGGRYVRDYPVGLGADFSGVVEEVGSAVSGFEVGDRVSALAMDHCGHCSNCRAGRTNLCLDPGMLKAPRQVCCQTHTLVNFRKLARLPDAVHFDDAAMLTGPVTALNALQLVQANRGDRVAVIGTGVMGWGTIAVARAQGMEVVAIGGSARRAELARGLGAERVVTIDHYDQDIVAEVRTSVPEGFAFIVETTATEWGLRHAQGVAAPGARLALMGGGALPMTGWDLVLKEFALFGVRGGNDQATVLQEIAAGRIDLKPTVTHRFPLEQAPDAFALLTGPDTENVGRVMVEVSAHQ